MSDKGREVGGAPIEIACSVCGEVACYLDPQAIQHAGCRPPTPAPEAVIEHVYAPALLTGRPACLAIMNPRGDRCGQPRSRHRKGCKQPAERHRKYPAPSTPQLCDQCDGSCSVSCLDKSATPPAATASGPDTSKLLGHAYVGGRTDQCRVQVDGLLGAKRTCYATELEHTLASRLATSEAESARRLAAWQETCGARLTVENKLAASERALAEERRISEGYLSNAAGDCGACAEAVCCGSTMHQHVGCASAALADALVVIGAFEIRYTDDDRRVGPQLYAVRGDTNDEKALASFARLKEGGRA